MTVVQKVVHQVHLHMIIMVDLLESYLEVVMNALFQVAVVNHIMENFLMLGILVLVPLPD